MPMNFPDMKSLLYAAKIHYFRGMLLEETEDDYRLALALHVRPIDRIESYEIQFKVGWDQWTDEQKLKLLKG